MLCPCCFSPLLCPFSHEMFSLISNFLEEISSLSHSVVLPCSILCIVLYFFALFTYEGFIISPCYSLELCIQLGISFPFTSLLFSAICKALQITTLRFCISFLRGMVLITTTCTMFQTSFFRTLCLRNLIP